MKIKKILFQIVFYFLITQTALAQNEIKINPGMGKDMTFSSVKNGFTYELKLPERLILSPYMGISASVINSGSEKFRLEGWLNNSLWISGCVYLEPGEIKKLEILFERSKAIGSKEFPDMMGMPGGKVWFSAIDPNKIDKITFKIYTKGNASLSISDVKSFGEYTPPETIAATPGFFPFIDKFGQFKHKEWPGKIKNESELREADSTETADLKLMPGPDGRDRFGGWADGPKLKATGSFRTEKVDGKWWLVDPEGCLYWSHGLTCITFGNVETRISGREKFFENLPGFNDPLGAFYQKIRNDTTFNFYKANLYRKYGPQWKEKATENVLKRLRSWGINSFGNWSDAEIYFYPKNRIPYTLGISPNWPKIDGNKVVNTGITNRGFPDVFDPAFTESVKTALKRQDIRVMTDSFCIGFYIDNELLVNDLTRRLMRQPVTSKSRQPFIAYLKSKYVSANKLNDSWKTSFPGWKQIENLTELPDGAKGDIEVFDLKILDIYYKTCREELNRVAPDKLYFGSRLPCHYFPDDQSESQIIKVAAQYCDVVCFNRYRYSAEDLILPFGIDKPTCIGEFHFGALDRGLPHSSLRYVANQDQRAESYYNYVEGALNNPQMVGTHWFEYSDPAYTGRRAGGPNYQIGFIDGCDNTYPETIAASRKIGYQMYKIRYGK